MTLLSRAYRGSPLHLLGHLACFALAAYAVGQLVDARAATNILAWFFGALVLHDLLFLPFYSALDRLAAHAVPTTAINHLRVPAVLSGVLALVFFPVILGLSDANYRRVSGVSLEGYARNWLLITGVLFAISAVLYAVRGRRAGGRRPSVR
jgi:hypothetical protein